MFFVINPNQRQMRVWHLSGLETPPTIEGGNLSYL